MIRGLLVAAAVAAAGFGTVGATGMPTPTISVVADCPPGDYMNSTGNCVEDPSAPPAGGGIPSGATALCRDGDFSYSQHRSGTCSGHGGVQVWE
jgi:hypothetical protein